MQVKHVSSFLGFNLLCQLLLHCDASTSPQAATDTQDTRHTFQTNVPGAPETPAVAPQTTVTSTQGASDIQKDQNPITQIEIPLKTSDELPVKAIIKDSSIEVISLSDKVDSVMISVSESASPTATASGISCQGTVDKLNNLAPNTSYDLSMCGGTTSTQTSVPVTTLASEPEVADATGIVEAPTELLLTIEPNNNPTETEVAIQVISESSSGWVDPDSGGIVSSDKPHWFKLKELRDDDSQSSRTTEDQNGHKSKRKKVKARKIEVNEDHIVRIKARNQLGLETALSALKLAARPERPDRDFWKARKVLSDLQDGYEARKIAETKNKTPVKAEEPTKGKK